MTVVDFCRPPSRGYWTRSAHSRGRGWAAHLHRWAWPAPPGTLRLRTTLAAITVVGVALLVGSVALVRTLDSTLTADARAQAQTRAAELAAAPPESAGRAPLRVPDEEEYVAQRLDAGAQVMQSSGNMAGRPALARPAPNEAVEIGIAVDGPADFIMASAAGQAGDTAYTVVVGRSLEDVDDAVAAVTRFLSLALPLLLLVLAATTWWVVGRALAPVDALRVEVEDIGASRLGHRVAQGCGAGEITRLAMTMNRMLARLEESHNTQRRFVSDASHELRSPVTTIRQHAEVALAHPDRTTVPALATVVLAEDLRLLHLVEALLLLARADEGMPRGRALPVDLDDLVFEHARRLSGSEAVCVDTSGVSAGQVHGASAQLDSMVGNLLDNAARHARGRIALSLHEEGFGQGKDGVVVLRVDDDGPGIPSHERTRVFERFIRLDDARSRTHGGAGLGLAIVAAVVASHHGTVLASDAPLGGLRVEVRLPTDLAA